MSRVSDSQSSSQDVFEVKVKQEIIDLTDSEMKDAGGTWSFAKQYTSELVKENVLSLIQAKPESLPVPRSFQVKLEQKSDFGQILELSKTLPIDRTEFLKLMKTQIDAQRYKLFLIALSDYRRDNNFGVLSYRLFKVFDHPRLYHYLVGMKRFIRESHRDPYEKMVNGFLIEKLK